MIEKYEKIFWPVEWLIEDQQWYKNYISKFPSIEYNVPEDLKDDFDWWLLMKLVWWSFSSDWIIEKMDEEGSFEFIVSVHSWDMTVVKKISELRWYQISKLYEIYIQEQMNIAIIMAEDEQERSAIELQQNMKLTNRLLVINNLPKQQTIEQASKEKEKKLTDLYNQL